MGKITKTFHYGTLQVKKKEQYRNLTSQGQLPWQSSPLPRDWRNYPIV
jgi:hypothetical protein